MSISSPAFQRFSIMKLLEVIEQSFVLTEMFRLNLCGTLKFVFRPEESCEIGHRIASNGQTF